MDPRPYAKDERLTIITVDLPDAVVAGTNDARHRARCVLFDESKRAAPLQPGDVVLVRSLSSGLALVERVTAGRPDGCWYVLLDFRPISHQDQGASHAPAKKATTIQRWPLGLDTATSTARRVTMSRSGRLHSPPV
jgi:hypothetical protein